MSRTQSGAGSSPRGLYSAGKCDINARHHATHLHSPVEDSPHARSPSPDRSRPRRRPAGAGPRLGPGGQRLFGPQGSPDQAGPERIHQQDRHQGQPAAGGRGSVAGAPEERGRQQPGRRSDHHRRRASAQGARRRRVAADRLGRDRAQHSRSFPRSPGLLVRIVGPRPGAVLRQGPRQAGRAVHLRGPGRSQVEGPHLRPLVLVVLQSVAAGQPDRGSRSRQGGSLGQGRGHQFRPQAPGRRPRPDHRRRRRPVRHRHRQHLLLWKPSKLRQGRGTRRRRQGRHLLSQPARSRRPHERGRSRRDRVGQEQGRGGPADRLPLRSRGPEGLRRGQQRVSGTALGQRLAAGGRVGPVQGRGDQRRHAGREQRQRGPHLRPGRLALRGGGGQDWTGSVCGDMDGGRPACYDRSVT
ncbi:hypothetical protein MTBSS4_30123 [Magnetospirillum sp. SS-4]|nr:hypothetical protein MTBSS4_30123 [Magnetospirillum sp. SS-4]